MYNRKIARLTKTVRFQKRGTICRNETIISYFYETYCIIENNSIT